MAVEPRVTRRLALALPLSILLHAAVLAAILALAPRFDGDSALFIDLVGDHDAPSSTGADARSADSAVGQGQGTGSAGSPASASPPRRHDRAAGTARPSGATPPSSARDGGHASRDPVETSSTKPAAPPRAGESIASSASEPTPSIMPPPAEAPSTSLPAPVVEGREEPRDVASRGDNAAIASGTTSGAGRPAQGDGDRATGAGSDGAGPRTGRAGGVDTGGSGGAGATAGPGVDGGGGDGSLASIGGGDAPGSEYGPYLAGVRRRIAESLRYPPSARRRHLVGTVQLEIIIAPSGVITKADVVASSSHPLLDEAAVKTVMALPPQPFPSNVRARTLRVRLPVIFALE
jgi:TonB family protein